jgi:hypothetical protein
VRLTVDYGERGAALFSSLCRQWGIPIVSKFASTAERDATPAVPSQVAELVDQAMMVAHDPALRDAAMAEARAILDDAAADVAAVDAASGRAA